MVTAFEDLVFPPDVDLINASYALPFCPPDQFDGFWNRLRAAVLSEGRFAGHFLGGRDEWAGDPDVTVHSIEEVRAALDGFEIESWKVLAIGATGFIGRHVVRMLTREGHDVAVLIGVRRAPTFPACATCSATVMLWPKSYLR